MPTINFLLKDGSQITVDAEDGDTIMHAAVRMGVRGLLAECGGACSCATCHVYVDDTFLGGLPKATELENELLDGVAADREIGSRLSCQIVFTKKLDGITVRIPERQ